MGKSGGAYFLQRGDEDFLCACLDICTWSFSGPILTWAAKRATDSVKESLSAGSGTMHDNIFDLHVTDVLPKQATNIHSAGFEHAAILKNLHLLLIGRGRGLLTSGPA